MEFNQTISTVAELINAGAAQADIKSIGGGIPFVVVPEGYKVSDIERLMEIPQRKRGAHRHHKFGGVCRLPTKALDH